MNCDLCQKNTATVHITEIPQGLPVLEGEGQGTPQDASGMLPPESQGESQGESQAELPGELVGDAVEDTSDGTEVAAPGEIEQRHVCEECARSLKLPLNQAPKGLVNIWKLLQKSARRAREEGGLSCDACGMTLAEFRSKGRLGCAQCYDRFRPHLEPLFLRIHSATRHTGRVPGVEEADLERFRQLNDLKARLEAAVRDEAYESAARIRDEIEELESPT